MSQFDEDRHRPLHWLNCGLQVTAGAVALTILTVGWLVGSAASSHIENLELSRMQATALALREGEVRRHSTDLATRIDATQKAIALAQARLGNTPQESRFVAQLTDLAEQAGLDVSTVRPAAPSVSGSLGVLELQLSCDGSYDSFRSFLMLIDKLPRVSHINGMHVVLADPQKETLRVDLQLQLLFSSAELVTETKIQ
jgi:Tfp pilus assembly protein PilO